MLVPAKEADLGPVQEEPSEAEKYLEASRHSERDRAQSGADRAGVFI